MFCLSNVSLFNISFAHCLVPQVDWLKNDEPLRVDIPHKYQVVGNGTQLRVRNIGYADTGAYMCQATSVGGMARDISSLIVQENPAPSMW